MSIAGQIRRFGVGMAALAASTPAAADMIATPGNIPQPDEGVLLSTGTTGNPVFGVTVGSGFEVEILGNEALTLPAEGQPRVEAVDGALSYLDFSLSNTNYGFASLILNLDAAADGTVSFNANDQFGGNFLANFALAGAGDNFFTFTAINGQLFTGISFTSTVDISDVGQIRIGGIAPLGLDSAVPEPTTWALMLMGFGAVGGLLRHKRRLDQLNSITAHS